MIEGLTGSEVFGAWKYLAGLTSPAGQGTLQDSEDTYTNKKLLYQLLKGNSWPKNGCGTIEAIVVLRSLGPRTISQAWEGQLPKVPSRIPKT